MTILNLGMDRARDLIKDDVTSAKAGTGTTLPTVADTGLETGVADTDVALTSKKRTEDAITVVHILTTALGNGSTLTEYEVRNANDDSYNRVVKAAIVKNNAREITMTHTFILERRNT